MNKSWKLIGAISIYIAAGTLVTMLMLYFYHSNDFFRSLFEGAVEVAAPEGAAPNGISMMQNAEFTAQMSFFILIFVMLLQTFAFISASWVFFNLRQSADSIHIKLKKMENADLFLDLPLYFGLFGTVSSFIIMTFNPQISRLIAYSSTLVGIIFSVVLRITLQYPIKQRLIGQSQDNGSK